MTRRLPLFLFAAFAALPLAAQTAEPPVSETTQEQEVPEIGDRVERVEQGLLRGVIVLVDGENLILETSEGDRAFSIRPESDLPEELRDAEAWAAAKGMPVSVAFEPGADGELRVVETVTLLPPTTVTTTLASSTPVESMPETDLGDESDVVEPTEVAVTAPAPATTTAQNLTAERTTDGLEISAANPDEREPAVASEVMAITEDDDLPPAAGGLASLPATASPLPLLALFGSLALLAALGFGRLEARRRRVPIPRTRR